MAQTKRKRKSKHRGNAAGMVEARGRTSRPTGDRKPAGRQSAVERRRVARRQHRRRPPRRALRRRADLDGLGQEGGLMAVLFGVILVVLGRPIPAAIARRRR